MKKVQNIINKPFIKIGFLLGCAFSLAQYLFYFSGRSIIMEESFGNTQQLLLIAGLYLGLHHCRENATRVDFSKLFLQGLLITIIAIYIRTFFAILLYRYIAPELGQSYVAAVLEQFQKSIQTLPQFTQKQYTQLTQTLISTLSIPILEGISLGTLGTIFSLAIAGIMNLFRKNTNKFEL